MKISTEIGSLFVRPPKEALELVARAGFDFADFSFDALPKTTLTDLSSELEEYRDIRRFTDDLGPYRREWQQRDDLYHLYQGFS